MSAKPSDAKDILDLLLGAGGIQLGNPDSGERTLDAVAILSLPKHLRKTALAIHRKGNATATMIADVTRGNVDLECANLEELVEMGYLGTEKKSDDALFFILT